MAFRRLGPWLQDSRQRWAGEHRPKDGPSSEEAEERVYCTLSAWDQIATIFSNPVVMTALCMLQEKVLINSGKAKSSNRCPFLSAFPRHSYVLKENRTFPLPLCRHHRHCLSFLVCRFLIRKDAHCLLPYPSVPCHSLLHLVATGTCQPFLLSKLPVLCLHISGVPLDLTGAT